MAAVSIWLVYVVFPLFMTVAGYSNDTARLFLDVAWLGIFVVACSTFILGNKRISLSAFGFITGAVVAVAILGARYTAHLGNDAGSIIPVIMEAKPFFYALLGVLMAIGISYEKFDLLLPGTALAIIIIGEAVIPLALSGKFVRPYGSGEINYDSTLLAMALLLTIAKNKRGSIKFTFVMLLGLFIGLSRTSIASFALALLTIPHIGQSLQKLMPKFLFRMAAAAAISIAIAVAFTLRDLSEGVENFDRYWMYQAFYDLLARHPIGLIFGFPPGVSLDVHIPETLEWLWSSQSEGWSISGIYPYNFHSMWLRLILSWGAPLTLLFAFFLIKSSMRWRRLLPFVVLIAVEGMTNGALYLNNVGVIVWLTMYVCVQPNKLVSAGAYIKLLGKSSLLRAAEENT